MFELPREVNILFIANLLVDYASHFFSRAEYPRAAFYCFVSLELSCTHRASQSVKENIKSKIDYEACCNNPFNYVQTLSINLIPLTIIEKIPNVKFEILNVANMICDLGERYEAQNELNKAIIFYQVASELIIRYPRVIFNKAKIFEKKKDFVSSIRFYVVLSQIHNYNLYNKLEALVTSSLMIQDNLISANFSNCFLREKELKQIFNCMIIALKEGTIIKLLDISVNKMDSFVNIFPINIFVNIEELSLQQCHLTDETIRYLSNYSKNSKLKILHLDNNKIGNYGFQILLENMPNSLKKLSFRNNFIDYVDTGPAGHTLATLKRLSLQLAPGVEIHLSKNFIESNKHNKEIQKILLFLIPKCNVSVQELLDSKFDKFYRKDDSDDEYILYLKLCNAKILEIKLYDSEVCIINSAKNALQLRTDSDFFDYLFRGRQNLILLKDKDLLNQNLFKKEESDAHTRFICKRLLDIHPNAPLKSYIRTHAFFRSPQEFSVKSLLLPKLDITIETWVVFLLAKIPKTKDIFSQHTWLAYEGLTKYGQRFFKVAHLTANTDGYVGLFKNMIKGGAKLKIDFFVQDPKNNTSKDKIIEYLKENCIIASFAATRANVKKLHSEIEHEVTYNDKVQEKYWYKTIISSFDNMSIEDKNKLVVVNCTKWACEKIKTHLGFEIPSNCTGTFIPYNVVDNLRQLGAPINTINSGVENKIALK